MPRLTGNKQIKPCFLTSAKSLNSCSAANRGPLRWPSGATPGSPIGCGFRTKPDFQFFAALAGVTGLFADIGANAGQSARSFRTFNRSLDIVSFEPNRLLEPDLAFTARLLKRGFTYRILGLGAEPGRIMLSVPMLGPIPQTPWATVDRGVLEANRAETAKWIGGPFTIVDVPIEIVRFDSLDLDPVAVKIDVEGFEQAVLEGMDETLRRAEPLLMLEHNDESDAIIAWLRLRGYDIYLYSAAANRLIPTDQPRHTTNFFACTPGWLACHPRVAAMTGSGRLVGQASA